MASHSIRKEMSTREVVTLKLPTNWAEVEKALAYLKQAVPTPEQYDNTVTVEADDVELRFVVGGVWVEVRESQEAQHPSFHSHAPGMRGVA